MKEMMNELQAWLKKLNNFSLPEWNNLPDLDLYMDQVITYLERELAPLVVEDKEKMITSWMINNYVKGNLLSSPIQKKYTTEHLANMFAICSVKQILSISDIAKLLNYHREERKDPQSLYQLFRTSQSEMIHSISQETLNEIDQFVKQSHNDTEVTTFLNNYVFKMAIEAEVKKIIADKILYLISKSEENKKAENERLEKEKQLKEKEQKEKEIKELKEKEKELKELKDKKPDKSGYLMDIPT